MTQKKMTLEEVEVIRAEFIRLPREHAGRDAACSAYHAACAQLKKDDFAAWDSYLFEIEQAELAELRRTGG